jgi:hypothetical protein
MTLAGNSLHEDDTALASAGWIASMPEATPGPDDLAEQIGGGGGQVSVPTTDPWAPCRRAVAGSPRGASRSSTSNEDGRITAHDNFFDQLSLMIQLGFAEPPPRP